MRGALLDRSSRARVDGDGPRRSLVLAGSGMRVAYQAGVLAALEEAGLEFAHVDATSTGVMNLAMLLSGLGPEPMCERWRVLSARDRGAPLPVLLARLGVDVARVNAATGLVGTFNVGNLSTRTVRSVPQQELSDELLLAAMTPPGPAVTVEGVDYADAAWIQSANLFEAVRRGAEEIWLVWCVGYSSRQRAGGVPSHDQLLELGASGGLSATFRFLEQLNERIAGGASPYGQRYPVRIKWVRPDYPLPRDAGEGAIGATTLVHLGYADAWRRLREREADDPLDVAALQVQRSESAVALDERFAGVLTAECDLGALEEDGGLRVELALSVFVSEVETFIAEGRRAAPLAGTIRCAGSSLGLRHGWVRRQTGANGAASRLVYEAIFQPRRAAHPLRLRLERRLPGADGAASRLEEVTVLEASVYDGLEQDAPRVAHGRLETSVEDLTASCRSLHPLEPASPEQSARAIVQLGRLLFGELYDAYTGRPWWKVW